MIDAGFAPVGEQTLERIAREQDQAALLSVGFSGEAAVGSSFGRKDRIQSAALLACDAARTIARESSPMTSSQLPI
jgi:hypothetical protein